MTPEDLRIRLHRVVEVYAPGAGKRGSGFAIGDDVVLTASHVVDEDNKARVRGLNWPAFRDGDVIWRSAPRDAALIRLPEPAWAEAPDRGGLRWVHATGGEPLPCVARGFPAAEALRGGGGYEIAAVFASLAPGAGYKQRIAVLDVTSAKPVETGAGTSPWQGLSGAALLTVRGQRLVGLVVHDPPRYGTDRLQAVPIRDLLADPEFADLVELTETEPAQVTFRKEVCDSLTPVRLDLPENATDLDLLRAEYCVVDFIGHARPANEMLAWCTSRERFSVAVLTGHPGSGKSRLAAHLGLRMAEQGWDAGIVRAPADLANVDIDWPVLVIVDNADAWPSQVADLVASLRTRRQGPRARVLLVSRTGAAWEILDKDRPSLGLSQLIRWRGSLSSLDEKTAEEHGLKAMAAFARQLAIPLVPLPQLSDKTKERPLLVHAAVLAALHGRHPESQTPATILGGLLEGEEARWHHFLAAYGLTAMRPAHARQLAALVTLTSPDRSPLASLVTAVPAYRDAANEQRERLGEWLTALWPDLRGVEPDAVADHLLTRVDALDEIAANTYHHPDCPPRGAARLLDVLGRSDENRTLNAGASP